MLMDNANYMVSRAHWYLEGGASKKWQKTQMGIPPVGVEENAEIWTHIRAHRTIQAEDMDTKIFSRV